MNSVKCHDDSFPFRLRDLVALTIIGLVLFATLLPVVQRVHTPSARSICRSNLSQIAVAMGIATDVHKRLPPVNSIYPMAGAGSAGTVLYHLLPFMEMERIHAEHKNSEQFTSAHAPICLFLCPADPSSEPLFPEANYSPNYFVFLNEPGGSSLQIPDGAQNTIAFSERRGVCAEGGGSWSKRDWRWGAWVRSNDSPFVLWEPARDGYDNRLWHPIHVSGMNVLTAAGGVSFVDQKISPEVWRNLVLPDDGAPADFR